MLGEPLIFACMLLSCKINYQRQPVLFQEP